MDFNTIIANANAHIAAASSYVDNGKEEQAKTELGLLAADLANALRKPPEPGDNTKQTDGDKRTG